MNKEVISSEDGFCDTAALMLRTSGTKEGSGIAFFRSSGPVSQRLSTSWLGVSGRKARSAVFW